MSKFNVMIARFPGGACDHPDTTDWLVETVLKAKKDPRIGRVLRWRKDDTPITMSRNLCLEVAKRNDIDVVCMIDSDMNPDAYLPGNDNGLYADPGAKPFWDTSLDFLLAHPQPCIVAAPYCGRPPHENVFVFQWQNLQSGHPNTDLSLEQFKREEAARMAGIQEVAALPTGLILIHTGVLQGLKPPHFYYEWTDETESEKASTEDVTFTRDVSLAGYPIYCNWDAWAGHHKRKCVGKPVALSVDDVREQMREAVLNNRARAERLIMVNEGKASLNGVSRRQKPVPTRG